MGYIYIYIDIQLKNTESAIHIISNATCHLANYKRLFLTYPLLVVPEQAATACHI